VRYISTYIILLITSFGAFAQMVPDFTLNDINGESHNLYSYLNDDKVVIVDAFATWCSSCWTLLEEERLIQLYNTYGPNGTDQLMIFFVETDTLTSDSDLVENPFGDWTKNVPYPVFNPDNIDDTFIENFATFGVPTTNVICPRTFQNIADIFENDLQEIIEIIQECNTISNVKDLQVLRPSQEENSICISANINFTVLNSGTKDINSFSVSAFDSDNFLINNKSINSILSPGESINVDLGVIELQEFIDSDKVTVMVDDLDDVTENNIQELTFVHVQEARNTLTLIVKSDLFAKDDNTRWWVENSNGDIVTSITYLESLEESQISFYLENNDCFTFVIEDDYGDGIDSGEILFVDYDGNVIFDNENFGFRGEASFEYIGFEVTSTNTLDEQKYQLEVVPNLVDDAFQINFVSPSDSKVNFKIYDALGSLVRNLYPDRQNLVGSTPIYVNDLAPGIYFVSMQNSEGILNRKFIKL